jgi:phage tail protein X
VFDGCLLVSINQWCKTSKPSCSVQYCMLNFMCEFDIVAFFFVVIIFMFYENVSVKICKYIRLSIHSTVFLKICCGFLRPINHTIRNIRHCYAHGTVVTEQLLVTNSFIARWQGRQAGAVLTDVATKQHTASCVMW